MQKTDVKQNYVCLISCPHVMNKCSVPGRRLFSRTQFSTGIFRRY